METTTSFDLNQAIQRWRESLAQSPAFRKENLDELEGHLRDSVAELESRRLSAEEAFMVASSRVGKVNSLAAEFGKMNEGMVWLDRTLWMLIGMQVWGFVWGLVGAISSGAVSLSLVGAKFDFYAHGRTMPIVLFSVVRLLALAGSLTLCWWLIVRKGPTVWFQNTTASRGARGSGYNLRRTLPSYVCRYFPQLQFGNDAHPIC